MYKVDNLEYSKKMAQFTIACPTCNTQLEMQDDYIGMEVECPICKSNFVIETEEENDNSENNFSTNENESGKTALDDKLDKVIEQEETNARLNEQLNNIVNEQFEENTFEEPIENFDFDKLCKSAEKAIDNWLQATPGANDIKIKNQRNYMKNY